MTRGRRRPVVMVVINDSGMLTHSRRRTFRGRNHRNPRRSSTACSPPLAAPRRMTTIQGAARTTRRCRANTEPTRSLYCRVGG